MSLICKNHKSACICFDGRNGDESASFRRWDKRQNVFDTILLCRSHPARFVHDEPDRGWDLYALTVHMDDVFADVDGFL